MNNGLFSVEGKVAVVTGGSRGIGKMIAAGLVDAGVRVYVSSRKAEACHETARELSKVGECISFPADLSNAEGCKALGEFVASREKQLDILVNNSGATWGAPIDEFPESGFDRVLDINVKGLFFATQALLPLLRAAGSADDPARVVNIGSVDGLRTSADTAYSYGPSKAAVQMLTRQLAKALAEDKITVNAINPGPFESKMMAFRLDDPEGRKEVEKVVPLHRIGRPDDMAGSVIFLCSRAGSYLTGTAFEVDGGIVAAG